jgi:hypothetical protein
LTEEGIVGRSYLEPYLVKSMRYIVPALHDLSTMLKGRRIAPPGWIRDAAVRFSPATRARESGVTHTRSSGRATRQTWGRVLYLRQTDPEQRLFLIRLPGPLSRARSLRSSRTQLAKFGSRRSALMKKS